MISTFSTFFATREYSYLQTYLESGINIKSLRVALPQSSLNSGLRVHTEWLFKETQFRMKLEGVL